MTWIRNTRLLHRSYLFNVRFKNGLLFFLDFLSNLYHQFGLKEICSCNFTEYNKCFLIVSHKNTIYTYIYLIHNIHSFRGANNTLVLVKLRGKMKTIKACIFKSPITYIWLTVVHFRGGLNYYLEVGVSGAKLGVSHRGSSWLCLSTTFKKYQTSSKKRDTISYYIKSVR